MSFYLITFVIVFTVVYFSIAKDYKILKFNGHTLITLLISILTISFYIQLSDNSVDLVLQKKSYEKFLNAKIEDRDLYREDVENLLKDLLEKENSEAGEIYIVARQLKNSNEFMLANMAYKAIYDRYKEDLDGNIIAEYAQTLFLSQGRKFNNDIDNILDDALKKNPLNPSALTLKGLSELEKNNPDLTIEYWNKTLPLLGSQKEKTELIGLIEAVKKRKNQ
jgi:hypothetical protein